MAGERYEACEGLAVYMAAFKVPAFLYHLPRP